MYTECVVGPCGNSTFSSGLCRKHYEQERLKNAVSCSISSCESKAYRGVLCSKHYREKLNLSHPICIVPNCANHQKTLLSGLCEKHLFRQQKHGSSEQTRPNDWGSREKHPLYSTYQHHRRKGSSGICQEWASDFWAFVNTVGSRPDDHTLRRHDNKKPLSPTNWYWKESIACPNKAAYAKSWRERNPEKAKNAALKKQYGITIADYKQMAYEQNNCCAICGEMETGKDQYGAARLMPVDHCHKTGKVRALLCSHCNKALGGFKDDPKLLIKAAKYIEKHLVL